MYVRIRQQSFRGASLQKLEESGRFAERRKGEEGWCISRRVRGMLLSGVISMGIGGPAPDCFIFKVYFRRWYIYWRGRGYVWRYVPRQYILCTEEGSIISGDFSDEETCQSEPTPPPPRSASAYGLLTVCFMPLYTWLDVYRHRIPTDRFLLPFYPASKSSARFYETCDLIDRATSSPLPLLLPRFLSSLHLLPLLSISRPPFFDSKSRKLLPRSFGRTRNIRDVAPARPRIWVTIQLRAVEGSRPTAFFESTAFLNIFETSSLFAHLLSFYDILLQL